MKFSVARSICEPEAVERAGCADVEEFGGKLDDEGSATVAGRFTRIRSVARGHSIYNGPLGYLCSSPPRDEFVIFYLPLRFEGVQINELSHYIVVVKRRSILLE